ncbi:alpha/beta hydrolase [Parasphingorhabdus litoris]
MSLWRAPADQTKPVIIHFHGNAGSMASRLPIYQALAQDGAGVLAVGYPGYGGNPGKPSEEAFYAVAQANYDWLLAADYDPDRIVIAAQSLGTGVATWLASKNDAAGLILEAAYTGMDDMAQRQFPILPARLLIKDRYRSIDRIDQINMPLSWIHGTNDELIPFVMGQTLFDAAKGPKFAHPIKNGGHNDLWMRGIDILVRRDAQGFMSNTK